MFTLIRRTWLISIFVLFVFPSMATHIMGGDIGYRFLNYNATTNKYNYEVTLKMYRYCANVTPTPSPLPGNVQLGVYIENPATPGAPKVRHININMPQISSSFITPPNPNDTCTFLPNVCVQEGIYRVNISVDTSAGYHLIVDRCCRNNNIINLDNPGNTGQAFYAYIGPTGIANSSPTFALAPVPYICANDTVSVLNNASDPDGDLLVYSLVTPYAGISGPGNPNPNPPANYAFPIAPITYAAGHNFSQPFGAGSSTAIDTSTGLTSYFSPAQGFYVVAIEIREFRNGQLVGITRRDLQLIIIACPPNPAPVLSGSGQVNFVMTAGQSLCFPVSFTDPNGDSLFLTRIGDIFNGAIINPPATMPNASGAGSVVSQFCWTPSCAQGQALPYQFSVNVNDNGCPAKSTNIVYSITVLKFTGATVITGPDTLCMNASSVIPYTIASTTGTTYSWLINNGAQVSGGTTNNAGVVFANPGPATVSVIQTSAQGCKADTVKKNVFIKSLPVASAGPDITYCSGQNGVIGAPSQTGQTYSWSPGTGLSSSTNSQPTVTLTNTGTVNDSVRYIVTVTENGCINRDTVFVIVRPLPAANTGPNRTICSGDTITLGGASTSGYTYVWSPGTGLSSTSVSNPTFTQVTAGTTTFTLTTTLAGCSRSANVQVTVNALPTVQSAAAPPTICAGQNSVLTGSGASTYSWATSSVPGTPIGTGATFSVTPLITTSYIVTGTDANGCKNKSTVTVTVNQLPLVKATTVKDSLCPGESTTLNASGAGTYSWALLTNPGTPVGTGPSLTVGPSATTSYILTGTDGNGCINKDTMRIFVRPAPTLTGLNGNKSVCPGVSGVPYWINPFNITSTYNWTISGGTILSGQGKDTIFVEWGAAGSGVITVREVTALGCSSAVFTMNISINTILTPIAPTGPTPVCANQALNQIFSVMGTPGSVYTWYVQGGTIAGPNGLNTVAVNWNITGPAIGLIWYEENSTTIDTVCFGVSDTFKVTINPAPTTSAITGTAQVCVFDSTGNFGVVPTTGSTYQWLVAGGVILTGSGTPQITTYWSSSGPRTVSVIETNVFGCKGDTISFSVNVNPLPQANAGPDVSVCRGSSITLGASGGITYMWTPGTGLSNTSIPDPVATPTNTTTYTVMVTDTNGCRKSDSLVVTVNSLPPADAGNDGPICIGSSTQLQATGGIAYSWTPPAGLSNPNISNPVANPVVTTTYVVVVTDGNQCSASDSVTITVNPLPVVSAGMDTLICRGTSVMLNATGGVSYSWTPAAQLNNPLIANPVATPLNTITYTVTATDVNGCQNTDAVTIDINPAPKADFAIDIAMDCKGITVDFYNQSIDGLDFVWYFGNGQTSTDVNPSMQYAYSINPVITLVAVNNICRDSLVVQRNLPPLSEFLKNAMPNVFTPNQDGKNDCFAPGKIGDFEDCVSFSVFNRWGNLIYEVGPRGCWNGKHKDNGLDVPAGVYFYSMKVAGVDVKGSLNLIR